MFICYCNLKNNDKKHCEVTKIPLRVVYNATRQKFMLMFWQQQRRSLSGCLVVHHSPNHKDGQTEQVRRKQKDITLMDLVKSTTVLK